VVTLYQGIALYFGPGATFFKWAVHGVVGFGIAGYLFQQLGRHVGTRATKKLFRSMPVTAALGILLILTYAFVAIFADFIAPYGQAEIFKDANLSGAIVSGGSGAASDKIGAMQAAGYEMAESPADIGNAVTRAIARAG